MLFNYRLFSKVYYFLFLLILITAGGTVGFMVIEGWGFVNSFYMTIITISTVGFSEVEPLSVYGRFFAAFLIISSFGTFMYAVSSISSYLVGGEYKQYFKEYKTMKEARQLKNHVIICGYGRVGKQISVDLLAQNQAFVIVESDEGVVDAAKEEKSLLILQGDATNDEVLRDAGIESARAVITCLPKDADNIYVVLAAREFNKEVLIVSRASYASAVSKLKMAGANNVIMPDSLGGSHMASLIANPDVAEFLDMIRVKGSVGARIDTISYEQLPESMKGKSIEELGINRVANVTIIGHKDGEGIYRVNPSLESKMKPNSRIFILGESEELEKVEKSFNILS